MLAVRNADDCKAGPGVTESAGPLGDTFVNLQDREQQIFAAYPAKGQALGDDEIFRRIRNALAEDGAPASAGEARPAEAGAP